jgi:hypothetical protein
VDLSPPLGPSPESVRAQEPRSADPGVLYIDHAPWRILSKGIDSAACVECEHA